MTTFERITKTAAEPEVEKPAGEKVISGDPEFTTWNIEEREGLYAGIWQSTPGAWRVSYDEWEYCRILSGHSILKSSDGTEHVLKAGDSFVIRPGFEGVWEVVETTCKEYVIRI